MKNNLLLEIHRVHEIMGVETTLLIKEQTTAIKLIKNVLTSFGDNTFVNFIKTGKNYSKQLSDDLLIKFKLGTITDDELKLFLKNINWDSFAKTYLTNPDLFGSLFVETIEKYYKGVIKNPSKYNEVISKLNSIIDDKTYFTEMPLTLKNAIKRQIKTKMDDALSLSNKRINPKPKPKYKSKTNKTIKWLDIIRKGFLEGWRAPGIIRSVFNWNTFLPNQNVKGWQLALRWFFTGTTRSIPKGFKEVWSVLVKKGVNKDFAKILATKIISVPSEVFARWVIINGVVFVFNLIVAYVRENGGDENTKREKGRLVMLAWEDIKNNWGEFSPHWVWPVATVWGPIIDIVDGIIRRETPGEIYDKIRLGQLPEQKEKEKLDSEIENADKNKTIIDKIKDKKNEIVNKFENTPLGFEMYVKSKGLTIKTPYDGVSGQTNENDTSGAKTNNWYFDVDKNTFISY